MRSEIPGPAAIEELLRRHGKKIKKSLGQHYLVSRPVLEACVRACRNECRAGDRLLEIGPGLGVLSGALLTEFGGLTAVEIDPLSVSILKERFADMLSNSASAAGLRLVNEDFLKADLETAGAGQWIIAGNLPYQVTSPVLFRVLEHYLAAARAMVFMMQKEVADRILSAPGSRTYGILSVILGTFYEISTVKNVPPGSFYPQPKVHSTVLKFRRKEKLPDIPDYSLFKSIIRSGFNQRRKKLKKALKTAALGSFDEAVLDKIFTDNPRWIDLRAEELDWTDYLQLSQLYFKYSQES